MQADTYRIHLADVLCDTPIRITFELLEQQNHAVKDLFKEKTGQDFEQSSYDEWAKSFDAHWDVLQTYFRTLISPLDEEIDVVQVIYCSTLPELNLLHLNFQRLRKIAFPNYPNLVPENLLEIGTLSPLNLTRDLL